MSWTDNKIKEEAQKDPNFMTWFEEETNKLDIAVTMTDLRVGLGLTQREFAEKAGKQQSVIARIESGKMTPSFKMINEIATAVGKKPTLTFN
ncbi:MAG: helix-turn-helix transcriptional regulator [Rickettsiales bacterium]|jgi:ribosome-binding protein aMBF1 (putative translation factor)|nr:helix-turn-helix transcriptional regulator [Rickettsiales bacterium]